MSASYFQPATDFPYDHGQTAFWNWPAVLGWHFLKTDEDWHFPLAPAAPMLPLILKTWGQGCISCACTALKEQPPEQALHSCPSPGCWLSACQAALPAGFRHSPALSGRTCQSRSVRFTPCLTSLVYLSLLSAKAQSSSTAPPQLIHRQQQGGLHGCFVGKDLN